MSWHIARTRDRQKRAEQLDVLSQARKQITRHNAKLVRVTLEDNQFTVRPDADPKRLLHRSETARECEGYLRRRHGHGPHLGREPPGTIPDGSGRS